MSVIPCLRVCSRSLVGLSIRLIRLHPTMTHLLKSPYNSQYASSKSILQRTSQYSTSTDPLDKTPEETIIHRLKRIEARLKFRGYSLIRITAVLLLCTGVGVYLCRDYLRENVADEVSSVASRSLGDEAVILKAEELSKALLQAILNDPTVKAEAVYFLRELIKAPEVQLIVIQLLANLLNDPSTQRKLTSTLKHLALSSLSDPTFRHNLAINLKDLFDDPVTREGVVLLLQSILRDQVIKDEANHFAEDVLASKQVREETARIGKWGLKSVVADQDIQKKTGDALWSAFIYSITPSLPWWLGGGGGKRSEINTRNGDTDSSKDNHTPKTHSEYRSPEMEEKNSKQ